MIEDLPTKWEDLYSEAKEDYTLMLEHAFEIVIACAKNPESAGRLFVDVREEAADLVLACMDKNMDRWIKENE